MRFVYDSGNLVSRASCNRAWAKGGRALVRTASRNDRRFEEQRRGASAPGGVVCTGQTGRRGNQVSTTDRRLESSGTWRVETWFPHGQEVHLRQSQTVKGELIRSRRVLSDRRIAERPGGASALGRVVRTEQTGSRGNLVSTTNRPLESAGTWRVETWFPHEQEVRNRHSSAVKGEAWFQSHCALAEAKSRSRAVVQRGTHNG